MKNEFSELTKNKKLQVVLLGLGSFVLIAGGAYRSHFIKKELTATKEQLAGATEYFENKVKKLDGELAQSKKENNILLDEIYGERKKNGLFENQIKEIAGTVGTLEKLQKTDKELLQKYSKVYFLNEHYTPPQLATISEKYSANKNKTFEIHGSVSSRLEKMLQDAEANNLSLQVISAYRSFSEQSTLKSNYKFIYGAGTANQFSADQGYSEHQLGTTLDFTTPKVGTTFSGFEKTPEYAWLLENGYKYGFVISYPKNNEYYEFEPWHWRFVGIALATKLHNENKFFYDLDQRVIDTYLVNIFD